MWKLYREGVALEVGPSPENPSGSFAGENNGQADCDMKKRKVVWSLQNVKGGQNKTLEITLSYDKDVIIDEV